MKPEEKRKLRAAYPNCYVCEELQLEHAGFEGYDDRQVQFDHGFAQGLVGAAQADLLANLRPIHAAAGAATMADADWETAVLRNCHAGKSDVYTGPQWVERVRVQRLAMKTRYSDDLFEGERGAGSLSSIKWSESDDTADFMGRAYPVMIQKVGTEAQPWRSFSTLVPPKMLWTDQEVQPREANTKRLADFAWHLKSNPLLSPILARWSPGQRKILVFDGNHRLSAYIMARGDAPVPVTIFDGPDPLAYLAVAVEAHDTLTQLKYQYSDKALKYSALTANELHEAAEKWGAEATEELAWQGMSKAQVQLRVVGALSKYLEDAGGYRSKWLAAGLTDPSWNRFIEQYARTTAESAAFDSPRYWREAERENLSDLCHVFDEELFDRLGDSRFPNARASLKTKWWKRAHAKFGQALGQAIMDNMQLEDRPRYPAYGPRWTDWVRNTARKMVINWLRSPAWNSDTTANNESDIDEMLSERQFTERYLRTGGG